MERMYFTFGSDPKFPYGRNEYLVIIGQDRRDCINKFKERYPSAADGTICCSDFYNEQLWNDEVAKSYEGIQPSEIIITDDAYGRKPKDYNPLWLFVPEKNQLVFIQEGSGDNLLQEDRDNGYVDYLDITAYTLDDIGMVHETDGGQLMTEYMVQEHYECLADSIPDVLDFLYDNDLLNARLLCKVEEGRFVVE